MFTEVRVMRFISQPVFMTDFPAQVAAMLGDCLLDDGSHTPAVRRGAARAW
jgi:hypothetical protein